MTGPARTLPDLLFGPIPEGRACGECNTCCELPGIDTLELQKPAGVLCPHHAGHGCGIYDTRPQTCRTYHCVWRRLAALPEEARPDRLGAMLHLTDFAAAPNPLLRVYIRVWPTTSWANVSEAGLAVVMKVLSRAMLPVWRDVDGELILAHPSREVGEIILNSAAPASPSLAAQAAAWVKRQSVYGQPAARDTK